MNNKKSLLLILSFILFYGCNEIENKNEETVETVRQNRWLWTANWNPNDDQISVGGTQDTLRLFSSETFKLTYNLPLEGTITKTKWHPIKNKLAIGMQDGKSKPLILNTVTKERITLDSLDESGARAIGWNQKGELLAVGDYSGFLNLYSEKGEIIRRIDSKQKSLIGLASRKKHNCSCWRENIHLRFRQ